MAKHAPTDKTVYDYPSSPWVRLAIFTGKMTLCGETLGRPSDTIKIVDPIRGGVDCPRCLELLAKKEEFQP